MAIKSNLSDGVIELQAATSDTVIFQPDSTRRAVTAAVLKNRSASPVQVNIYESDSLVSAGGVLVAEIIVPQNDYWVVEQIIGQSYIQGVNLVAVMQTGGFGDVNFRSTFVQFTGDD